MKHVALYQITFLALASRGNREKGKERRIPDLQLVQGAEKRAKALKCQVYQLSYTKFNKKR